MTEKYKKEKEEIRKQLRDNFDGFLNANLTPREQAIIIMRYSLKDENIYTLQDVGEILGATRERIRQIQAKAICKLEKSKIIKTKI